MGVGTRCHGPARLRVSLAGVALARAGEAVRPRAPLGAPAPSPHAAVPRGPSPPRMRRLSSPVAQMRPRYDAVVVGSGYGGAIAASRLARAGLSVCVLERGPERLPGEFPDTLAEATAELQAHLPDGDVGRATGLFDFHVGDEIAVLVGCGLGGTSLINANVSLRADPRVFDDPRWPQAVRDDAARMAEGYARAEAMLRPTPYPETWPALDKLHALERAGAASQTRTYRTPINVTFEDGVNHVGVEQRACSLCGDCVSGCNHGAKNTTQMNYLPDAWNHGAEIFTCVEARRLERPAGGDGWLVHYSPLGHGRERFDAPEMFVAAGLVVLAAGPIGSSTILLRSRAAGVPLSARVGQRFSGNGDVLAFAFDADQPVHGIGAGSRDPQSIAPVGPCITGVIDARGTERLDDGMVVEEGVIPGALASLDPLMFAAGAALVGVDRAADEHDLRARLEHAARDARAAVASARGGAYTGGVDRSQTYLVMAHDAAAGEIVLDERDRPQVRWPRANEQPIWGAIDARLRAAAESIGARFVRDPLWARAFGRREITVHPLGGCVMAERAEDGVVNHKGQAFAGEGGADAHPDLYVCDGSVIPRSLGVNPLLTISALAERCCAIMAEERGWTLDAALPSAPSAERVAAAEAAAAPAIEFTETMRGYWAPVTDGAAGDPTPAGFRAAAAAGKAVDRALEFTLTVVVPDVPAVLADPGRPGMLYGTVKAPALSPEPLQVTGGVFQLFAPDPDLADGHRMRYRMTMRSEGGQAYTFEGYKLVRPGSPLHVWPDTSTLYVTVRDGADGTGEVVGRGVLNILPLDFQRQMTTMRVTGAADARERVRLLGEFGKLFAGVLAHTYGPVAHAIGDIGENAPPRKRRTLRAPAPEVHPFTTQDGTALMLTRYRGGDRGPIVLAPGFGTPAAAYTPDTVETNFVEFLTAAGYDAWLLDYRSSPALPSSSRDYTIDDVAREDWPAAVALVRHATGAEAVQVVAHCVGSLSFMMAKLAGLEGVRSAVLSGLTVNPRAPVITAAKAALHMPDVLRKIGVHAMSTDPGHRWVDRALQDAMALFPTKERCNSPVCRRILFMYGDVFAHAQLNEATHDALHEWFGVANMRAFEHLAEMVHAGHAQDAEGKDVYMPNVARLAFPISFIQGELNHMFLPEGSQVTYDWLRAHNDPALYRRLVIPGYAHMDAFIGRDAARDVFPVILQELQRFDDVQRTAGPLAAPAAERPATAG